MSAAVEPLPEVPPTWTERYCCCGFPTKARNCRSRLRQFLAFVGNPQQQYRSVHVGGTSGKGSTAALIASLLHAGGYHTGLHVSPYLQVETEKLQLDGRLMPAERFAEHVAALDGEIKRWIAQG